MIAVCLIPVYAAVNIFVAVWLMKWLSACSDFFKKKMVRVVIIAAYLFCATALLTAFFLPAGELQRYLKSLGNYWLGIMIYGFMVVFLAAMLRIILKRVRQIDQARLCSRKTFVCCGAFCAAFIAAVCTWGIVNARIIRTTEYNLEIQKDAGDLVSLNIVLVADLHLGYNVGCSRLADIVDKINAQTPDLVVIAGDIFDNEYEALEDPERMIAILQGIESKYGVYACYGNHDIQEKILAGFTFGRAEEKKESDIRMDELMKKANIRLLRDESVLIADSFYLYGRPDLERPGRGIDIRKTPAEITADLDLSRPVLVIDHEPRELQELANAGVDLDLCGHTHDGQFFPGNVGIKFMWENACGHLKKDHMHNIVTSGAGVFGPDMRVGTASEICRIQVNFSGS